MRRRRPPSIGFPFGIAFLFLLIAPGWLTGQNLLLPDIVLPGRSTEILRLPGDFTRADEKWNPAAPRFRRVYSVVFDAALPPWEGVELRGIAPLEQLGDPGEPRTPDPPEARGTGRARRERAAEWGAEAGIDVMNHLFAAGSVRIRKLDYLGVRFRVGFPEFDGAEAAAALRWKRLDRFSVDAAVGGRNLQSPIGAAFMSAAWERGMDRPDSYHLHFMGSLDGTAAAAGSIGLILDVPLGSSWNLAVLGDVSAAVRDGRADFGYARAAIGAGALIGDTSVSLHGGADVAYHGSLGLVGAPFLRLRWFPSSRVSVFAKTGLISEIPHFLFEGVTDGKAQYGGRIPMRAEYKAGFDLELADSVSGSLSADFSHGSFYLVRDSLITTAEDLRIGGRSDWVFPLGPGRLTLEGLASIQLNSRRRLWFAQAGYAASGWYPYLRFGSENAFLARSIPGLKSEAPIMGLGIEWKPVRDWVIEVLGYATIPWDRASIIIQVKWSH